LQLQFDLFRIVLGGTLRVDGRLLATVGPYPNAGGLVPFKGGKNTWATVKKKEKEESQLFFFCVFFFFFGLRLLQIHTYAT
jgi:hypothetical protein